MANMQQRTHRNRLGTAGLLVTLLASGCATPDLISPNDAASPADAASPSTASSSEAASWTNPWRRRSDTTSSFGLDGRAKEIERNLGVYR